MPGVGVRTAARILLDVGDASAFPTAGHLGRVSKVVSDEGVAAGVSVLTVGGLPG